MSISNSLSLLIVQILTLVRLSKLKTIDCRYCFSIIFLFITSSNERLFISSNWCTLISVHLNCFPSQKIHNHLAGYDRMTSPIKTISPFSTVEHYQKIIYELVWFVLLLFPTNLSNFQLLQLSKDPQNAVEVANVENNIAILRNHVEQIMEKRLEG